MIVAVTDSRAPVSWPEAGAPVPSRLADRLRSSVALINLIGVALVMVALVGTRHLGLPVVALSALALAGWTLWVLLPLGTPRDATAWGSAVAGAAAAGLGFAPALAPMMAAVVAVVGFTRRSVVAMGVLVAVAAVVVMGAGVLRHASNDTLLTYVATLAVSVLLGVTRRQRRASAARERALLERSVAAEHEAARGRLLEERQAAARDVHDVLAHSLGGLVLQLDAIEALLERGRVDEAAARAAAARALAGEGLAEARRAVATLRDPGSVAPPVTPDTVLADLVATHLDLGAVAVVDGELSLAGLDEPHREALARTLQEALSNARRHAPGAASLIRLRRDGGGTLLRVATPAGEGSGDGGRAGGGHGLIGMRERFASLGDGSTVTAGPEGAEWVVSARMPR